MNVSSSSSVNRQTKRIIFQIAAPTLQVCLSSPATELVAEPPPPFFYLGDSNASTLVPSSRTMVSNDINTMVTHSESDGDEPESPDPTVTVAIKTLRLGVSLMRYLLF